MKGLLEGLLTPLRALGADSAQSKRDFTSWMGSAGLFATGSGLLELKGGVVIDSNDPALSRAAVGKLAALLRKGGGSVQTTSIPGTDAAIAAHLPGLPVVLDIADGRDASGHDKFVIGLGEASVEAALNPSSTLSGAASLGTAAAALGEGIQPSVIVDFPTLLGLLEGVGLSEDPTYRAVRPVPALADDARQAAARASGTASNASASCSACKARAERTQRRGLRGVAARRSRSAIRDVERAIELGRAAGRRDRRRSARASFRRRPASSSGRAPSRGRASRRSVRSRPGDRCRAIAGAADRVEHDAHRLVAVQRVRRRAARRSGAR